MPPFHQVPETNILEITLNGGTSGCDFDAIPELIGAILTQHGTIKIILVSHDSEFKNSCIWDELNGLRESLQHCTHAAIISDRPFCDRTIRTISLFIATEIRAFDRDKTDKALQWLIEK